MAIGNYWECVLPAGTDLPLQRIVGESRVLFRHEFASWKFDPDGEDAGGADFSCLGFTTGDLRAITHLVKRRILGSFYLHSAFPWAASGAPVRLTLSKADTNHFGLEGFLTACAGGGPSVTFFDPLFALNKGSYQVGTDYVFALGAFSLDLNPAALDPVRVTNPDTAAHFREAAAAAGHPHRPEEPMEIDTSRAKMLVGAADDAPDYYFFQGPVRSIRQADFLDRPFLVFRTAVVDLEPGDFLVDIYMDRARFKSGITPRVGDMVSGTLWLQGHLSGEGA